MRRALKWIGWGLGGLVAALVLVAVVLMVKGGSRLARSHDVSVKAIAIPTGDEAAIARGRHLVEAVALCSGCHGDSLAGEALVDARVIATIWASNLTPGNGGIGTRFRDVDYVRAIRHGIAPDGRGLMIMHSDRYHGMGEADLGAVIAYLKSLAPVDHEVPPTRAGPLGKVLVALGLFDLPDVPLIPAELIDHTAPFPDVPPEGATAEYGGYLAHLALCTMCHGRDLTGGPPLEEGGPPATNVAAFAGPDGWSDEEFLNAIRTGTTPYGRALDSEHMPWEYYAKMTDVELSAIWRYVQSLARK